MNDDVRNINLVIADRPYRLKVTADEELIVKKAADLLKVKVNELKQSYQAKDRQDFLAMAALMYCVENLRNKEAQEKQKFVDHELVELDNLLTDFLKNASKKDPQAAIRLKF